MSGSVSIISEAIHSGMDLLAALIAYVSVSVSSKPADQEHPYGHGKIENVSGFIEGILIFIAAILIIKQAVEKLINPVPLHETSLGIVVMIFSAVINTIVAYYLYQTAQEEDSIALEADALHLKTDVYTSLGVAAGLLAIKLTGWEILDPLIAIFVSLIIIKEAYYLCLNAFHPLLDSRLPHTEEEPILKTLSKYINEQNIEIEHFKTRKAGSQRFIDFHVLFPADTTVRESTSLVNELKGEILKITPRAHIHIHTDVLENE